MVPKSQFRNWADAQAALVEARVGPGYIRVPRTSGRKQARKAPKSGPGGAKFGMSDMPDPIPFLEAQARKALKSGPGGAGNRPGGIATSSYGPPSPRPKVDASTRVRPSVTATQSVKVDTLVPEMNARAHSAEALKYVPLSMGAIATSAHGAAPASPAAGPYDLPVPGGVPPTNVPINVPQGAPADAPPTDEEELAAIQDELAGVTRQMQSPEAIRAKADLAKYEEFAKRAGAVAPARDFMAEFEGPPPAAGRKPVAQPDLKPSGPNPVAAGLSGLAAALFPGAGAAAVGAVNRATAASNILARQNALDTYRMQDEASDEEYRDRLATRGEALAMGLRKAAARTDMERERVAAELRRIGSEADVRHARVLVEDLGTLGALTSKAGTLKATATAKVEAMLRERQAKKDAAAAADAKARHDEVMQRINISARREQREVAEADWHRKVDVATADRAAARDEQSSRAELARLGIARANLSLRGVSVALAKKVAEYRMNPANQERTLKAMVAADKLYASAGAKQRKRLGDIAAEVKSVEQDAVRDRVLFRGPAGDVWMTKNPLYPEYKKRIAAAKKREAPLRASLEKVEALRSSAIGAYNPGLGAALDVGDAGDGVE